LTNPVAIDISERAIQEPPIDRVRELHQRMLEVDDRIEARAEQGVPPLSSNSRGRIESPCENDPGAQRFTGKFARGLFPIGKKSNQQAVNSGKFKPEKSSTNPRQLPLCLIFHGRLFEHPLVANMPGSDVRQE